MWSQTAKPILATMMLIALNGTAFAQEGVIDVFEDQSEMKATSVRVESTDGSPIMQTGAADGDDATGSMDGGFTLRYEKRESSILVPATVEGQSVYFLFDTGATYTTLDVAFATRAGVMPGPGGPVARAMTANGMINSRVGLINSLVLGGRNHAGVTFHACANCPSGTHKNKPIVGLLGMNVIGRYRTSFDHSKGLIEMTPTGAYSDRSADINPWTKAEFRSVNPHRNGKHMVVHGVVKNRARRSIREMTIRFSCSGGTDATSKVKVGGSKTQKFSLVIKDGDCRAGRDLSVMDARW